MTKLTGGEAVRRSKFFILAGFDKLDKFLYKIFHPLSSELDDLKAGISKVLLEAPEEKRWIAETVIYMDMVAAYNNGAAYKRHRPIQGIAIRESQLVDTQYCAILRHQRNVNLSELKRRKKDE